MLFFTFLHKIKNVHRMAIKWLYTTRTDLKLCFNIIAGLAKYCEVTDYFCLALLYITTGCFN